MEHGMSSRRFALRSLPCTPLLILLVVTAMAVGCSSREQNQQEKMIVRSLQASDLKVGTGPTADEGQTITINYTVWLYDSTKPGRKGQQLESTLDTHQPATIRLGADDIVPAIDEAVPGMRVGGTRELFVPSSLGYGSSGHGAVPPNVTLVFDVTLLSVKQ
jgi:FKBP-type peptidyl-prolyl cis-trans isomerase FkpA